MKIFKTVGRVAGYRRVHLIEKGRVLVSDYHRHVDWEEANFFSAVTDHLLPEDWRAIAPRFTDATDPLAGNPVDHCYRALFRAIDAS